MSWEWMLVKSQVVRLDVLEFEEGTVKYNLLVNGFFNLTTTVVEFVGGNGGEEGEDDQG